MENKHFMTAQEAREQSLNYQKLIIKTETETLKEICQQKINTAIKSGFCNTSFTICAYNEYNDIIISAITEYFENLNYNFTVKFDSNYLFITISW